MTATIKPSRSASAFRCNLYCFIPGPRCAALFLAVVARLALGTYERPIIERPRHDREQAPEPPHLPRQDVESPPARDRADDEARGLVGGQQERHPVWIGLRQRRVHVPRADGDDLDSAAHELDAQTLEVAYRRGLGGRVRARPGKTAKAGHTGDADELSRACRAHRR